MPAPKKQSKKGQKSTAPKKTANAGDGDILGGLNDEQKKAVTHKDGPLLIVAGAGTGKTTVITRRVAWLIREGLAQPDEILGLTFTNKAAEEMEERIDKLLPYGYVDLWVSTFHTFCQRILESHAFDIGIANDAELLDDTGQWLLVREHLDRFELDYYRPTNNPTKFIRAMLSHFSRLKDEEIAPEQYMEYAQNLLAETDDMEGSRGKSSKKEKIISLASGERLGLDEVVRVSEVASAYHTYQQLLLENNKMDFGDLIAYTLKLFKKRPNVLKQYQEKFKYVLVDEFQDTNWAQYDLVKMLALPQNNLTVVADDDQSIYRFRGASMSNVIQFSREFKTASHVSLVRNYRSGQSILDLSHDFIQKNNPNRLEASGALPIDKKLRSQAKEAGSVVHLHCKAISDEARAVVRTIQELKKKDPEAQWNDFAVLVRANAHARPFEEALSAGNVPHRNFSAAGLYKTRLIADLLAFFDVLLDHHESKAIFRLLILPFLSVGAEDLINMTHYASRRRIPLYDVVKEPQRAGITDESAVIEARRVHGWVEEYANRAKREKPSVLLLAWLQEEGGYLSYLNQLPEGEALEEFRLLRQFWEHIVAIEEVLGDPRVPDVLSAIREEKRSGFEGELPVDAEAGPDMVKLMTIHSAKGLEFKYVFVVNLVDRRFPTIQRKDPIEIPADLVKEALPEGDVHLEEERRLMYVAMTRAKSGLFLSSAESYGGVAKKKLSRFLMELEECGLALSREALATSPKNFLPKSAQQPSPRTSLPIPKKFSFTQLRVFDNNPFEYKLQFIYKIPMSGKYVFSYGSTMHSALQKFFQLAMERTRSSQRDLFGGVSGGRNDGRADGDSSSSSSSERSQGGGLPVALDLLFEMYEASWIDDWYEDADQKDKYHKQGKARLKQFYEHLVDSGELPNVKSLERAFNLKIGEYTLIGRIDRVDQLPDGSVRIVDYKTGKPKQKLSHEDKQQLLLYQIAAEDVFGERVSELVYHYIDAENSKSGENQLSFLGTDKEKEEVLDWAHDIIERIHQGDFMPNPDDPFPDLADYFNDLGESGEL